MHSIESIIQSIGLDVESPNHDWSQCWLNSSLVLSTYMTTCKRFMIMSFEFKGSPKLVERMCNTLKQP